MFVPKELEGTKATNMAIEKRRFIIDHTAYLYKTTNKKN